MQRTDNQAINITKCKCWVSPWCFKPTTLCCPGGWHARAQHCCPQTAATTSSGETGNFWTDWLLGRSPPSPGKTQTLPTHRMNPWGRSHPASRIGPSAGAHLLKGVWSRLPASFGVGGAFWRRWRCAACKQGTSILPPEAAVAHELAALIHIVSLLVSFARVMTSVYVRSCQSLQGNCSKLVQNLALPVLLLFAFHKGTAAATRRFTQ